MPLEFFVAANVAVMTCKVESLSERYGLKEDAEVSLEFSVTKTGVNLS